MYCHKLSSLTQQEGHITWQLVINWCSGAPYTTVHNPPPPEPRRTARGKVSDTALGDLGIAQSISHNGYQLRSSARLCRGVVTGLAGDLIALFTDAEANSQNSKTASALLR
jgi:hypothetical protein